MVHQSLGQMDTLVLIVLLVEEEGKGQREAMGERIFHHLIMALRTRRHQMIFKSFIQIL